MNRFSLEAGGGGGILGRQIKALKIGNTYSSGDMIETQNGKGATVCGMYGNPTEYQKGEIISFLFDLYFNKSIVS